ncbi:hypothetical protein MKY25_12430 [Geobacillus sp. FSL W8-0032]|nr:MULTISPECIES: hypothetical protein [Geobacillus]KYD23640.1 hypothetical protein B4113_3005 [Geobacillus sp. B4113_201601]
MKKVKRTTGKVFSRVELFMKENEQTKQPFIDEKSGEISAEKGGVAAY